MGSYLHDTALNILNRSTKLKIKRKGFWKEIRKICVNFCNNNNLDEDIIDWLNDIPRFVPDGYSIPDDGEPVIFVFEVEKTNPIDDAKYNALVELWWLLDAIGVCMTCITLDVHGIIRNEIVNIGLDDIARRFND